MVFNPIIVIVVALVCVVHTQNPTFPNVDPCISNCIIDAGASVGCISETSTDFMCICTSTTFYNLCVECLTEECTPADLSNAEAIKSSFCVAYSSASSTMTSVSNTPTAASTPSTIPANPTLTPTPSPPNEPTPTAASSPNTPATPTTSPQANPTAPTPTTSPPSENSSTDTAAGINSNSIAGSGVTPGTTGHGASPHAAKSSTTLLKYQQLALVLILGIPAVWII